MKSIPTIEDENRGTIHYTSANSYTPVISTQIQNSNIYTLGLTPLRCLVFCNVQ